ncbi:MAG TPA: AfsR/SARP family transcriptional regulator [Acidimicrobiia bacterium]|nr:AfsR/SARP family transcriptional regulator [Acidimicrobiia bacterium]
MHEHAVSFRILGPIGIRVGGAELKISAPRQRALLAQLLIHANRTVTAAALIDGIYGDSPPQHPEAALHIIVSRLRRILEPITTRLVHDRRGYRIVVEGDELDLTRARRAFERGMCAVRSGDMRGAATAFDGALACWSGDALTDVSDYAFAEAYAWNLRELQLEIVERRNDAYLECGRHVEVLRDIETWIATEPWRERLRGQHMLALYRSGRQIDALDAFNNLRNMLVENFGVEPGEELKELYGCILRQEPQLLGNLADVRDLRRPEVVSTALAAIDSEVAAVAGRLGQMNSNEVFIVDGGPEVNKTWLVVEVSGRIPFDGEAERGASLPRVNVADSLHFVLNRLANDSRADPRRAWRRAVS